MAKIEWTETQRIELCAHIVPLIRSGLPMDRGLKSMAADLPKRLVSISGAMQSRLENGEPLTNILAAGNRPESRSLSATIAAGEMSGDLGILMESWAAIQTTRALAKKRFRLKLVYPVFLILITVFAIGFSIQTLVPQYRSNLLSIHAKVPYWFEYIEFVYRNLIAWGITATALSLLPILYFGWRRATYDPKGWPRDPAYRTLLQSHASTLAAKLIASNVPSGVAKELAVTSLGVPASSTTYLDPASRSIFDLLDKGVLEPAKAVAMHTDISRCLLDRSQVQIESQGRWIVYSVSISVAIVVGLSYLLVIYLPWIYLLDQLKQIRSIR